MTEKETKKVKITFPGSGLVVECEPKTALYYHHIFAGSRGKEVSSEVIPVLSEEEAVPSGPLPFADRHKKRGRPRKEKTEDEPLSVPNYSK